MAYINPGAAFSHSLEETLMQREQLKRQAMEMELAQKREDRLIQAQIDSERDRRETMRWVQEDRLERAQDRKVAAAEKIKSGLVRGDVLTPDFLQQNEDLGVPLETLPVEPTPASVTPMEPPGALAEQPGLPAEQAPTPTPRGILKLSPTRYAGNRQDQMNARLQQEQEAYVESLPEGPLKTAAMYELRTGKNAPTALLTPATQPVMRIGRSGKMENIGDAPAGAHFVTEPAPSMNDASMGGDYSAAGIDTLAKLAVKTGASPRTLVPYGSAGAAVYRELINRMAQYDPATDTFLESNTVPDLASAKAAFSANQSALTQQQRTLSAVRAFTNAAEKNSALFDQILEQSPETGTAWLNRPFRAVATGMGSETMATFNVFRQSLQNEYSRIITNPNLTGVLSDTARKEMEAILAPGATGAQIRASLKALKAEAANRASGLQGEIDSLKSEIKGGPAEPAPETTKPSAAGKSKFEILSVK